MIGAFLFVASMHNMADVVSNVLWLVHAAYSMGVMRTRALLDTITDAPNNVDLGAMLTGFKVLKGSSLGLLVNTTARAYNNVVKGYQRDGELADVSGNDLHQLQLSYDTAVCILLTVWDQRT